MLFLNPAGIFRLLRRHLVEVSAMASDSQLKPQGIDDLSMNAKIVERSEFSNKPAFVQRSYLITQRN